MKRGVWLSVLCVVAASAAYGFLQAEPPETSSKRRVGRYSQRYFNADGSANRSHSGETTDEAGPAASQSFKLRPVKPISEIGATDVPLKPVPRVPSASGDNWKLSGNNAKANPATTGGRSSAVNRAYFQDTPRTRKTGSIRQISTQPGPSSPFPPVTNNEPPKSPAKGNNPFAGLPSLSAPPRSATKATPPVANGPIGKAPMAKSPPTNGLDSNDAAPSIGPFKPAKVSGATTKPVAAKPTKVPTLSPIPNAPRTSMITTRWVKRSDINVGQNCRFDLVVKNTGAHEAKYVSIEVAIPVTVRLIKAKPMPSDSKTRAIWTFDSLPAGEKRTIELTVRPSAAGDINMRAAVRSTSVAPGLFTVNEPKLKIAFIGATKVLVGDPAPQVIEISNPGTGIAKSVAIEATIPKGLQHPRGGRLAMEIGALNPGETRKVRLTLKAITSGDQVIQIKATSEAALTQVKTQSVNVSAPSLKVAIDGPGLRYVGRNALYTITVTNDGSIATNNVRVLHRLPEGTRFLKADKGGSFTYSKRTVGWFVGRLEPGNSVKVKAIVACNDIGKHVHLAGAVSEQGTKAQTKCTTNVDGIASLAVGISNPDDPVEVGAATTYEIRVRNKGTKADTNVVITCHLPAGMSLMAAKGVTRSAAGRGKVVFAPLKSLPPGKTAIYRVQVRGATAGNMRFKASVRSDSMTEELSYAKLTRFYAD